MSNERVIKAAEAVEDLRAALDRWCARVEDQPNALNVHTAGSDAVAAVDQALAALHSIRNDTVSEIRRFNDAQGARLDALLGAIERRPLDWSKTYYCRGCGVTVVGHETCGDPTRPECKADLEVKVHADYECGDCGATFPVDPADPMVAHGNYLDHMDDHERADIAAVDQDPAELAVAPKYPKGTPEYAAYETELRAELQKFVAGEPPYAAFESPEVPR